MANLKTSRLNLRLAERDESLFRKAASLADETLSEFLLESARERAERLLADRVEFVLDDEAWDAFTKALDRPAQGRVEVLELFARPRPE